MVKYFVTLKAEADLDELANFIAKDNLKAALKLYDMAAITFANIASEPKLGKKYNPINPALKKIRFFPIKSFQRYLVFYQETQKGVKIIRILHQARNIKKLMN